MFRLAYFVSHPIQYQAPLLRKIAADPDIDLTVFFHSDFSLKSYHDKEFGQSIQWDIPLVEGYKHEFLKCVGSDRWYSWLKQPIATNVSQCLREENFDAVWIHGWQYACNLQAMLVAERLGIPVLLRSDFNGIGDYSSSLKKLMKAKFLNWVFGKVAGFLCVGTLNRRAYQRYGVDESRLFSMPYAVDNDFFQEAARSAHSKRDALRQSLGLEKDRPVILYAAKLIAKKCPHDLLAAYQKLSLNRCEPDPYFLFVGDGDLRSSLEAEAVANGWHSIRFLGFRNQSEIPALYDLCDVFVLPSEFEPWGLAINEVMNAGKAVIVTDQVGCAPDLVTDGKNGRIYPVHDVDVLARSIQWALEHSASAGEASLHRINHLSFCEDIDGLKAALSSISESRSYIGAVSRSGKSK